LGLRGGREIDREHIEPLLGEPNPVAPFAVGDRERFAARGQQMRLRAQEYVWLGSEHEVGCRKSGFPAFQFAHARRCLVDRTARRSFDKGAGRSIVRPAWQPYKIARERAVHQHKGIRMANIDDRLAALERRVRLLEDQIAIYQVMAAYGPAADSGSTEQAITLWSEDGVYDLHSRVMTG